MAMEVVKAQSKEHRDTMFQMLRLKGNALEKQAVRFSEPEAKGIVDSKGRMVYTQAWFVAYPTS